MRSLTFAAESGLTLREVPIPAHDEECLIRVVRAGICGTDLQMLEGYAGYRGTLGHEFVGIVETVGNPVDAGWIGKRVTGEINIGCGYCVRCRGGVKEHCESRAVLGIRERDGAFADYLTLPAKNLHEVPDTIDDDTAVFVEPIAAACRILEQVTIEPHARIAVLGDGRMGLLVAQVLNTSASDVTVIGRHDAKLRIASELGISTARRQTCTPGTFDLVVDVTGRPEGLPDASELVRPRGTVILKSTFHGEAPFAVWPVVVNEVSLIGSRCGPFDKALELLAAGSVVVEPLIAGTFPLEDFARAFADARAALKILFAM